MDSLYSGAGSFRWATLLGVMLVPLNGLFKSSLPVALSLTMLMQAFVCMFLGMQFCKTDTEMGVAGLMGIMLATLGSAKSLIFGIALYLLLNYWGAKKEKPAEE